VSRLWVDVLKMQSTACNLHNHKANILLYPLYPVHESFSRSQNAFHWQTLNADNVDG